MSDIPSGFYKSKGQLLAIDPRCLNDYYGNLKQAFGKYVVCGHNISKWVAEDGDGLYPRAAVNAGIALIKSVIDGDKKIGQNWPDPSPEHVASFSGIGTYGTPWRFRGNVWKNITSYKRGKQYEIGVKKGARVTKTGFTTLANTVASKEKIPVARYAAWVEYGTKWMAPRPLFSLAAIYYANKVAPALGKLVKESVGRTAKTNMIVPVGSKYATEIRGTAGQSQGSFNAANSSPEKDFSELIFKNMFANTQLGDSGIGQTNYGSMEQDVVKAINKGDKTDSEKMKDILKGLTGKDLEWAKKYAAEELKE